MTKPHNFLARLWRIPAAFGLCLLLSGCVMPPAQVPPYLALLTPLLPVTRGTCSGAVISPLEVVTAAHCVASVRRVVTANGQEAWVIAARVSTRHDIAVLTVDRILFVSEFAEFGHPALGVPALAYGYCPYQVSHVPRRAFYNGLVDLQIEGGELLTYGEWIMPTIPNMANKLCGGDSGGFLSQGGKIVGITSAVYSDLFWVSLGSLVYTVPVEALEGLRGE